MTRSIAGARAVRLIGATITASLVFTACQSDSVTSGFTECTGQPGCQAPSATVAPEVIRALDDINSRVVAVLQPAARLALAGPLAKLELALQERDIDAGRIAIAAAFAAITQAERVNPEARPDLGAIRLSLVPAARSLGLSISSTEAPAF